MTTADLLIREVDEELKQEQLQAVWKKHGSLLVSGAVALVLAVVVLNFLLVHAAPGDPVETIAGASGGMVGRRAVVAVATMAGLVVGAGGEGRIGQEGTGEEACREEARRQG